MYPQPSTIPPGKGLAEIGSKKSSSRGAEAVRPGRACFLGKGLGLRGLGRSFLGLGSRPADLGLEIGFRILGWESGMRVQSFRG